MPALALRGAASLSFMLLCPVGVLPSILEKLSALAGLCMASVSFAILAAAASAKSGRAGGTLLSVTITLKPPPELLFARRLDVFEGELKDVLRPKDPFRSLVRVLCCDNGGGGGGGSWEEEEDEGGSPDAVPGRDLVVEEDEKKELEKKGVLLLVGVVPDFCMSRDWCGLASHV